MTDIEHPGRVVDGVLLLLCGNLLLCEVRADHLYDTYLCTFNFAIFNPDS